MGVPKNDLSPPADAGQKSVRPDLRSLERVRAIFTSLSKYINAKTIYAANNPNVEKFANVFSQSFQNYFENEKELVFTIGQYKITWNDEVVYENHDKTDSIAFLLYKDGIGELIVQSSVKLGELNRFVDLLKNEIYNPSSHLDIVSRIWEADFSNISYRVFDECTDGSSGDGSGSGATSREKPLQAEDHRNLPHADTVDYHVNKADDRSLVSFGTYLYKVIEQSYPGTTGAEKEQHIQSILQCHFTINIEEFAPWHEAFDAIKNKDKLLQLLDIMLDFAQSHYAPAVVRDITDIIDRLVRYIIDEANISTLITLLHMQKKMASSKAFSMEFQPLPQRIGHELTNMTFLIALGRTANRSRTTTQEVLQYFQYVGRRAVPGVCELLRTVKDSTLHKEACEVLLAVAKDEVMQIVERLNLDNPHEARDAIYLLHRIKLKEIPDVIKTLLTSPDLMVRQHMVEYLAEVQSEEAAQMLVMLLEDKAIDIRVKTLAAIENFKHPLIVNKVKSMSFNENLDNRQQDELERLFRTAGKLAGETALAQIKNMIAKKSLFSIGKSRSRQNKLLAITALRYIPGEAATKLLKELAGNRDKLIQTKALHALKQSHNRPETEEEKLVPSGCEGA